MPELREVKCLDHGFVRLVDTMGSDRAIVEAARLSIAGEGVRPVSEDRALIRYLMRHRHTTPFEMCEFKFHCKMPIFVARQWIRHRTASVNEMSGRYSELPAEYYVPNVEDIQLQDKKNKQGRAEAMDPDLAAINQLKFQEVARRLFADYAGMLQDGMARELARINLPLSTYTEWYWKIDLHNLFHFCSLRLDKHAQMEIRVYAEAMATFVQELCPIAWEAFVDYRLDGMVLSRYEVEALSIKIAGLSLGENHFPTKREAEEWEAKLQRFKAYVASFGYASV